MIHLASPGDIGLSNKGTGTLSLTGRGKTACGTVGPRYLILRGKNTGDNTFAQEINDLGTGKNITSLTKKEPGTWVLTGINTYTGKTSINAGTLVINGNQAQATGAVSVETGATLAGSGTVGGSTTVNSGALLAPGAGPAVLSFAKDLTLTDGSTTTLKLTGPGEVAGSDYQQIRVPNGTLCLGGTLQVVNNEGRPLKQAGIYKLFNFNGRAPGNFSAVNVAGRPLKYAEGAWTGSEVAPGLIYTFTPEDGKLSVSAGTSAP